MCVVSHPPSPLLAACAAPCSQVPVSFPGLRHLTIINTTEVPAPASSSAAAPTAGQQQGSSSSSTPSSSRSFSSDAVAPQPHQSFESQLPLLLCKVRCMLMTSPPGAVCCSCVCVCLNSNTAHLITHTARCCIMVHAEPPLTCSLLGLY